MDTTNLFGVAAAPIITALIEAFKPWVSDKRWWPLVAIALGIVWNVVVGVQTLGDLRIAVIYGVITGLAASGLYSAAGALRGSNA